MEPHHRRPSKREGAPPLGGKLSRSLRSLRPIAAASVVTGPRRFPEAAWTHRRGSTATTHGPAPPGSPTTPKTGHPEGGWTTPKTRHPQGGWTTPKTRHPQGGWTTPKTRHLEGGGLRQWGATRAASEPACRRAHAELTRWNRTTGGQAG